MAALIRAFIKNAKYAIEIQDPRANELPFMTSPFLVFGTVGLYLWFIYKGGPAFMKNRKPYNIDLIMQVYNAFQVVFCSYLCYCGVEEYWSGRTSFLCGKVDFSRSPEALRVLRISYYYVVIKFIDLLDTVFFVLRKKQSQITFLHVYHHAVMAVVCWIALKYIGGGHAIYFGTVNCFVHAIMYSYYFITSYDHEYRKNIWWKKYLTLLQLVQFASMFVHAMLALHPSCDYPKEIGMLLAPQNLFISYMFYDFYRKTYGTGSNKK